MKRFVRSTLTVLVSVFVLAIPSFGQGGATGAISGTVQDANGAYVSDAQVQVFDRATQTVVRTVQSGADGAFSAPLLPVGTYDVIVSRTGFADTRVSTIDVRVTETARIPVKLSIASEKREITVNSEVPTVETSTAATGQSIEHETVTALPLATQNFQQLLTLSSGTASNLNNSASLGRGDVRIEVNGQREDNNNYLIEGISATDYNVAELTNTPLPSPDAIQEFKVQTSMYDATQGRNGGGNINAILRSGTLKWHADVFEFFRNTALDANEYFLKQAGQARPDIKQNIFGGSVGGPLGPKAKLGFIFFNYQGTRQRSGFSPGTYVATSVPTLPTDRTAASLISSFFPNSTTPVTLDPVAVALLNVKGNNFGPGTGGGWLIPSLAGTPGGTSRLNYSDPGKYTDNQFTTNWDRDFRNGNDKISARFFFTNFESILPFGAGGLQASLGGSISPSDLNFPFDMPVHDRFFSIAETHIFNSHLLNEFRFGYVRINNDAINTPVVSASDLGISRPNNNVDTLPYKFSFASFQIGPTPAADQTQTQNNLTFLDTVAWMKGTHSIRFGGEVDRVMLDKNFPQVFNGQLFFSGGAAGSCPTTVDASGACSDFQNFLLGAPGFFWGGSGVSNHQYRIPAYSMFIQDDWRIRPNFTINAGLRLDVMGAAYDNLCHIGNTVASLSNQGQNPFIYPTCVNKFNVPGLVGTTSKTTMENSYARNWGPRLGFAWDVGGHQTTSVRGGAGIYYVREDVGAVDQLSFTSPFLPITYGSGAPGTMATLYSVGSGKQPVGGVIDPAYVATPSQFLGFVDSNGNPTNDTTQTAAFNGNAINLFGLQVPRHFVSPSTAQWNLTVQRQLPGSFMMEVGYVGTKSTHLRETRDAIQPYFATPQNPVIVTAADGTTYSITQNTLANMNARSRALGLGASGYQLFADDANSNYNSLQVSLTRHFRDSLYLQASYTFSKSIDETSSGNTAFNTAVNDQTTLQASRGLSDFDRPHRFVVSWVYDLPFFAHSNGFARHALGGWALSGVVTYQSGTPFSVIDSAGGTALGSTTAGQSLASWANGATLGNVYSGGSIESRLNGYINLSAFQAAPIVGPDNSTGYGNLSRNIFRGPFQQNWDMSLSKTFKITERQEFKFGTQWFNVWNHPVFANPSVLDVESASNFGQITSTVGTPRLIQFSARYSF
jgi:hypothetical protein